MAVYGVSSPMCNIAINTSVNRVYWPNTECHSFTYNEKKTPRIFPFPATCYIAPSSSVTVYFEAEYTLVLIMYFVGDTT
jgi:hypothetical protein